VNRTAWRRWWSPLGVGPIGIRRRLNPVSRVFGIDRGKSICRYYIEEFLHGRAQDIHGRVLEIADDRYTKMYGGNRVTDSQVLHVTPGNPKATIVADLTQDTGIPSDSFDCIVLTQTLPFIFDVRAAVRTLHRVLKPGGVLLTTLPGISQISRYDMDRWGDYWRFTTLSARRLFQELFPADQLAIETYGNVLTASAYLYGVAAEELSSRELDHTDPDYEVLIAVRARKPFTTPALRA
jgi:SAM-dependent methyltransferase